MIQSPTILTIGNFLPPKEVYPLRPWGDTTWMPLVVFVVGVLVVALAWLLWEFLRLPSLARRSKALILAGPLLAALALGFLFGVDCGLYVALGFTVQVTFGVTWSERCQALLHDPLWVRLGAALCGCLLPFTGFWFALTWYRSYLLVLRNRVRLQDIFSVVVQPHWLSYSLCMLIVGLAAFHHMRAKNRAREWIIARETGEPPDLPSSHLQRSTEDD